MRAAVLFAVSLCLAHASPGRRRSPVLPSAEPRQGGGPPVFAESDERGPQDDRRGFYHGPPKGFPSFDHLFHSPSSPQPSAPFDSPISDNDYQQSQEDLPPPTLRPTYPSSAGPSYHSEGPTYPSAGSSYPSEGPSYAAEDAPNSVDYYGGSGPVEETRVRRVPSAGPFAGSTQPIVLKVSGLQSEGREASSPGGPSVFYAPSPDMKIAGRAEASRHRRSLPRNASSDPMLPAASTLFWPSSPFISFDSYKGASSEDDTARADNATTYDSTSEEQRFFPSFPSPYLSPFASRPHHNTPLAFPGPSANHRPSRYPSAATPILPFSKFPSRGPSSAASHDARYTDTNILGSGNFEVVRGGTYYGDEGTATGPSYAHHGGGGGGSYHSDTDDDYYSPPTGNGHSSPYRGGSGGGGGDFFANFRDFADINPHSRSFSHHSLTLEEETPSASSHAALRSPAAFPMEYDPMVATF